MSLNKLFADRRAIAAMPILLAMLGLASIAWQVNHDLNLWQDTSTATVTIVPQKQVEAPPLASNNPVLSGLFGSSKSQPRKRPTSLPQTRLKLSISGLFANADGSGQALIAANNKAAKLYHVGAKLPGDAVLESVGAEHVVLRRAGRFEQLRLLPQQSSHASQKTAFSNTDKPRKVPTAAASASQSANNNLSLTERLKRLRAQN